MNLRLRWICLAIMGLWGTFANAENEQRLAETLQLNIGDLQFPITQLDQGRVNQGEELLFQFPYEVSETGAVTVLGVHQECGCLTQSLKPGQTLPPGHKGLLTIRADTRSFTGLFDKTVTLMTNEESGAAYVFRMKARVERVLTLSPPLVEMNLSQTPSDQPSIVRIQSVSKQRLHIEKVVYNEDNLDVQFYPVQDAWELKISWKGSIPKQPWVESIEVTTNSSVRTVKIPVVGMQLPITAKLH